MPLQESTLRKKPGRNHGLFFLVTVIAAMLLSSCSSLDALFYEPRSTPQSWLEWQPHTEVWFAGREWVLTQPSSTFFVYLLGVAALFIGIRFLHLSRRIPDEGNAARDSLRWWGAALMLWGSGALLAGTSYELFSYEIKCAGHEFCRWTSWWEIAYLMFSLASVNAMTAAQAERLQEPGKTRLKLYAVFNTALYASLLITGTLIPVRFLISFEMLIFFTAPTIITFLWLNGFRRNPERTELDRKLLWIWIGLIAVIGAYFGYYMLGFTDKLWQRGVWFSENDVLHIGLIVWMLAINRVVSGGSTAKRGYGS